MYICCVERGAIVHHDDASMVVCKIVVSYGTGHDQPRADSKDEKLNYSIQTQRSTYQGRQIA